VLSPDSVVLGSYQVNGVDGWDGNTGFYGIDMRAPLAPGQSKTWLLYLWATEGTTASDIGVAAHLDVDADSSLQSRLELVQKPAGLAGGPAVGTVWTTSHTGDIYLPRYKTSNGLNGYGFNLTLTMVPEPSSILALAGGIAGLGGLSLRRRRK
jgi:hypothetical protein